jgi:hypothetical protein
MDDSGRLCQPAITHRFHKPFLLRGQSLVRDLAAWPNASIVERGMATEDAVVLTAIAMMASILFGGPWVLIWLTKYAPPGKGVAARPLVPPSSTDR